MDLDRAKRLIPGLRREPERPVPAAGSSPQGRFPLRPARAASVCVASGKGGTGKSVLCASLGALFALRARTLIVDADMGVGNAHLLQDVSPERTFVDVVQGRCDVGQARASCPGDLDLIGAGSGVSRMAALSPYEMHLIASGLERIEGEYETLIVDSAAGISEQTLAFAAASDLVLVVTTPDVTAMTDAYAFLKVLYGKRARAVPWLVVNRILGPPEEALAQANHVADRIGSVCRKFLGTEPRLLGFVPDDPAVVESVARRQPVVHSSPGCRAALAIQAISVALAEELSCVTGRGLGAGLMHSAGYGARIA